MSDTIDRFLVLAALDMAIRHRKPVLGLIFHSDRGSQYASHDFQDALAAGGILASMSGKGNCMRTCSPTIAPAESWFATLKIEGIDGVYGDRAEAGTSLFDYIEVFYNLQRLHSKLGYLSPLDYEQQFNELLYVA